MSKDFDIQHGSYHFWIENQRHEDGSLDFWIEDDAEMYELYMLMKRDELVALRDWLTAYLEP